MKRNLKYLSTLIAGVFISTSVGAVNQSEEVVTSRIPAKIHVIQNFEGWNDVLIRFSGVFRNSCYSKKETTAKVEGDQIYIENFVSFTPNQNCLMVLSPYSGQIAIRDLKEGTYDVLVKDKLGQFQEMTSFKTE